MHASLAVSYRNSTIVLDCGEDWLGKVMDWRAQAILVTHAHPDHSWGLKRGAPCPVYATADSWESLSGFDIERCEVVEPRVPVTVGPFTCEAFTVEHSTRAPAVGYRVTAGRHSLFYAPDLVYIHERDAALGGCALYCGDGATLTRPIVRKRGEALIGHAPMRTQLTWCQKEGVPGTVFTHCGKHIVGGDEQAVAKQLDGFARERGVTALIAYDGMELTI